VFESFLDDWSRLPVKSLGLQIGLSKRCALDITAGYGVSSSAAVRGVAVSEIVGEDERALSAFAAPAETFGNIERQWTRPRGAFVAIEAYVQVAACSRLPLVGPEEWDLLEEGKMCRQQPAFCMEDAKNAKADQPSSNHEYSHWARSSRFCAA